MTPIKIVGDHDENTIAQIKVVAETGPVVAAALMPDGHLGYSMPIGGVAAYDDAISPSGVGFDIGCGVMAVETDLTASDIVDRSAIADEISSQVSFGLGRKNETPVDHDVLYSPRWFYLPPEIKGLKQLAADQLGTVGSGNHYVDVLVSDSMKVWVATHFGSRGLGHKTATYFLKQTGAKDGMMVPPSVIEKAKSPDLFDSYVNAMRLAGEYAYAGRQIVIDTVLAILGAKATRTVHNHHNFAWEEGHFGQKTWVVRKGATPSSVPGFVGGSMGDWSAIVVASEGEDDSMIGSTVHGSGRIMSRSQAAGKYKKIDGKKIRQPGKITQEMFDEAVSSAGIVLRGGGYDESPYVYRKLDTVLDFLSGSVDVVERMFPIIVCMAGRNEFDPYKD